MMAPKSGVDNVIPHGGGKEQPWKSMWLRLGASNQREDGIRTDGTSHGFEKGEPMIMDGNIQGSNDEDSSDEDLSDWEIEEEKKKKKKDKK